MSKQEFISESPSEKLIALNADLASAQNALVKAEKSHAANRLKLITAARARLSKVWGSVKSLSDEEFREFSGYFIPPRMQGAIFLLRLYARDQIEHQTACVQINE